MKGGQGQTAEHLKNKTQDVGLNPLALRAMAGFKAEEWLDLYIPGKDFTNRQYGT